MHTFRRIDHNTWGVLTAEGTARLAPGNTIVVTKRDGSTRNVRLGDFVRTENGRDLYRFDTTREAPAPEATPAAPEATAPQNVGDMTRLIEMFDRAAARVAALPEVQGRRRRQPAIVLSVPLNNNAIRLSMAATWSSHPNTVNVTSEDRRRWFGRIDRNGVFTPRRYGVDPTELGNITTRLREFAADPAGVASAHGRATNYCCFCRHGLTDPRSITVGYGPDCAANYGLPWGNVDPATVAALSAPATGVVEGAAHVALAQPSPYPRTRRYRRVVRRSYVDLAPAPTGPNLTPTPVESGNPALIREGSE